MFKNSKRILTKLLAEENVEVILGNFPTASFDLKSRVLRMPDFAEGSVQDMLLGHEVGHALWSGDETILNKISRKMFDVFNVLEDIRIEKMIQMKYPGFRQTFKDAYVELNAKDFFSINGKDINTYNFIDRLNIKSKLQELIDIEFSDKELNLVRLANSTKSLDDVIELTKKVYGHCSDELKENSSNLSLNLDSENQCEDCSGSEGSEDSGSEGSEDSEDSGSEGSEGSEDSGSEDSGSESDDGSQSHSKTDEEESDSDEKISGKSGSVDSDEETENPVDEKNETSTETSSGDASSNVSVKSETQKAFDEKLDEETQKSFDSSKNDVFFQPSLLKNIITFDEVYDFLVKYHDPKKIDKNAISLKKKEIKKEALMVFNEFNRKKSAKEYSREKTSKTGVLDVNKMHSYKYNDDIFLRNAIKHQGKNHYLYMLLDMSGSMAGSNFFDSIKQCIVLADFCKLAGVSFKIMGYASVLERKRNNQHFNSVIFDENNKACELVELLSSDCPKAKMDFIKTIFLNGDYGFGLDFCKMRIDGELPYSKIELDALPAEKVEKCNYIKKLHGIFGFQSSTPTFEAIACAKVHINKLKKINNDALFSLIILTDGVPNVSYGKIGFSKNKTYVNIGNENVKFEQTEFRGSQGIKKLLKSFTNLHSKSYIFLNFYPKALADILRRSNCDYSNDYKNEIKIYRTSNMVSLKDISGVDEVFAINTVNKIKDDFSVDSNSTPSQLKKFVSNLNNKSIIKKFFAKKFSDLIS